MDRKSKDGMPRYQQIAMDVATQIVKQQYKVGDRIYARSALASKYHVSPETAGGPSACWRIWTLWRRKRAVGW